MKIRRELKVHEITNHSICVNSANRTTVNSKIINEE